MYFTSFPPIFNSATFSDHLPIGTNNFFVKSVLPDDVVMVDSNRTNPSVHAGTSQRDYFPYNLPYSSAVNKFVNFTINMNKNLEMDDDLSIDADEEIDFLILLYTTANDLIETQPIVVRHQR